MPGIPLYQPPFGAMGNILMALFIGASLGIIVAWSESGGVGVLWSSMLGALFIAIATLFIGQSESGEFWRKFAAVVVILVPTAAALAPIMILFRWAISREEQSFRDALRGYSTASFRRIALPASLVLVAGVFGLFSLYNDLGRAVIRQMDLLIQQGRRNQSNETLPDPLRPPDVTQFSEQGNGPYTLQWEKDDQNQFAIPRPAGNAFEPSIVIARFDSGYLLVCMYPGKTGQPTCRDF